jgi:cytochrome c2
MTKGLRALVLSGSLLGGLLPSPAGVADTERGRLLYENHCMSCHESVVHIREQRKAVNPAELRGAIQRWAAELKLRWQDADVNDVYRYLNNRYYKFQP